MAVLSTIPYALVAADDPIAPCDLIGPVLNEDGIPTPITNVVRDKTLVDLLVKNDWARPYSAALGSFNNSPGVGIGKDFTWTQDGNGNLLGRGTFTGHTGRTEVNVLKNPTMMPTSSKGNEMLVDFYVDIFVHPTRLSNVVEVMKYTAVDMRRELGFGDDVKFIFRLEQTPAENGPYEGFHRLRLFPNIVAMVDGQKIKMNSLMGRDNPKYGLLPVKMVGGILLNSVGLPFQPE